MHREKLHERLEAIVGPGGILSAASDLVVYECDGYTIEKNRPDVVVFPTSAEQVVAIVKTCNELDVPFLPRGAGVDPGRVNLWLTNHRKPHGFHFAPDPSSQGACTIGGNVATNSGGPHTLKYGVTVNHVLGLELV